MLQTQSFLPLRGKGQGE